ncbi:RPP2B [Candida theae]|uniref:RPP2B n=1 Tax=Candida theae TaxID=1198502 RepID=A0AAD5BHU6_9ASCO|nr:RPP2B [Candida theae]KAI5963389.1 RPP2B [Candida theae]
MKYLAAYLLLVQGGNASPSASDISSLLESVGVEVEESRLSTLLKDLEGKDINELIAEGNTKLASVPSGGAAVASGSGASAAAAGGDAEEAKEEAKEEEKEESDDDMGFGLFD